MRAGHAGRQTDGNHKNVVNRFRSLGAKVQTLTGVGDGCPDLLVGYLGVLAVVEVKPGDAKEKHQRELNENEVEWHRDWRGFPVFVVLFEREVPGVLERLEALSPERR